MANYILRTLLTTFPLPITLWGASGHRSDQADSIHFNKERQEAEGYLSQDTEDNRENISASSIATKSHGSNSYAKSKDGREQGGVGL